MPTVAQAGIVATVVFVALSGLELAWGDRSAVKLMTTSVFAVLGLIYVPLCALAAVNARGRLRAAWRAMTIGLACWASGEFITAYYVLTAGEAPSPSWADAAYLTYVPFVVLALMLFPSLRSWREQGRMLLDGVIVAGSFFVISWVTVLRSLWLSRDVGGLDFAVSLAYPVSDVLILTLAFLVALRAPCGLRTTFTLLAAGLACAALADSVWVYATHSPALEGRWLSSSLYLANALLIIVALVAAYHAEAGAAPFSASRGLMSLWLPVVPLVCAAVVLAESQRDVVRDAPVVITGAVLIGATLLRQLMESAELIRRERENRRLRERLSEELDSASSYVASSLPGPLNGPVQVSSRYLPGPAVGGDTFGYRWIDDDHLIVYLVDVSGHGVGPALLSVSVHRVLSSEGLSAQTLLQPDAVLAEVNSRFGGDDADNPFSTIWYGVYRRSTCVLRYAVVGQSLPLILMGEDGSLTCASLTGDAVPAAVFGGSELITGSRVIPAGAKVLLYSDGVLGDPPLMADFVALCSRLASGGSFWLDDLIDEAPESEGDKSLVLLTFPAVPALASVAAGEGSAGSAAHPR